MTTISYNRQLPVDFQTDICVVGGGPAGMAAAVSAARSGAHVFLAEAHTCLGGMGTAGMVPAFMSVSDGIRSLIPGFGDYLLDRMRREGALYRNSLSINAEKLKRIYDRLIQENKIRLRFQCSLVDLKKNGDGTVEYAIFACKNGLFAVQAKIFIDCTGDGDLAALAGAPFQKGDDQGNMMPGTLCSSWDNVDFESYLACGKVARDFLPQADADHVFKVCDPHHPGMWQTGSHTGGGNIGHVFHLDATDCDSVTAGLMEGRRQTEEFATFYRGYVPGFADCHLTATGSLLGVRESRRIQGEYTLVLEDFISRASFPDEIGRYNYCIDIHGSSPDSQTYSKFFKDYSKYRYGKGESYGIPYRVLLPLNTVNILTAGRCVSCDRYLQSSIRVMPGCFITGQGAGLAAAAALGHNLSLRELSPELLQRELAALIEKFSDEQ